MVLCIPCTIAPFGGASLCVGGACSAGPMTGSLNWPAAITSPWSIFHGNNETIGAGQIDHRELQPRRAAPGTLSRAQARRYMASTATIRPHSR
jgi:hypothetical protein